MTQEKLRIGVIGIGMYAFYHHIPQLLDTGRVEIAAICRRNQKKRPQKLKRFSNAQDLKA